jgi:RimJ/RimL family protein N-acetyltransferase
MDTKNNKPASQHTLKNTAKCSFRPLAEQDFSLMFEWAKNPHVAWWWQTAKQWPEFVEKYKQHIAADYIFPFIMQVDNTPIGYIQYYYADMVDIDWCREIFSNSDAPSSNSDGSDNHSAANSISSANSILASNSVVGIDIFIGNADYFAKGYGTIFMQKFIDKLWESANIKKIIVDPQPENLQAVKCFEKLGFMPVRKENIFYMELDR